MRKIIFLMHTSLDGFVARPDGDMTWVGYNDELEQYVHALHASTDTAIYGRVTYEMMANYWPGVLLDPESTAGALDHARWATDATKIVFSKTMNSTDWENTVFMTDIVAEELQKLKEQPGKDLWLLGSPSIAQEFMRSGLIDEYRININPIIIGQGIPLFTDTSEIKLRLIEAKTLQDGIVALRYVPDTTT